MFFFFSFCFYMGNADGRSRTLRLKAASSCVALWFIIIRSEHSEMRNLWWIRISNGRLVQLNYVGHIFGKKLNSGTSCLGPTKRVYLHIVYWVHTHLCYIDKTFCSFLKHSLRESKALRLTPWKGQRGLHFSRYIYFLVVVVVFLW